VADLEDQTVAQDIMTDGIMQIAGGIETIVQQLQLKVRSSCHYSLVMNAAVQMKPLPACFASAEGCTTCPEQVVQCERFSQ